jgi:hypothetical protein
MLLPRSLMPVTVHVMLVAVKILTPPGASQVFDVDVTVVARKFAKEVVNVDALLAAITGQEVWKCGSSETIVFVC